MARIYTRVFSDKAYQARLPSSRPSPAIAAGKKRLVRTPMGSEGRIVDLSVKQTESETQVAFTVDILKSKLPFPDGVDADIPVAQAAADTLDLYRVGTQIVVGAGNFGELVTTEIGYAYKNMDGTSTNNQPELYLLITPTSAGTTTTWKISITVESQLAAE
jgi:hypothetical protein